MKNRVNSVKAKDTKKAVQPIISGFFMNDSDMTKFLELCKSASVRKNGYAVIIRYRNDGGIHGFSIYRQRRAKP